MVSRCDCDELDILEPLVVMVVVGVDRHQARMMKIDIGWINDDGRRGCLISALQMDLHSCYRGCLTFDRSHV